MELQWLSKSLKILYKKNTWILQKPPFVSKLHNNFKSFKIKTEVDKYLKLKPKWINIYLALFGTILCTRQVHRRCRQQPRVSHDNSLVATSSLLLFSPLLITGYDFWLARLSVYVSVFGSLFLSKRILSFSAASLNFRGSLSLPPLSLHYFDFISG